MTLSKQNVFETQNIQMHNGNETRMNPPHRNMNRKIGAKWQLEMKKIRSGNVVMNEWGKKSTSIKIET